MSQVVVVPILLFLSSNAFVAGVLSTSTELLEAVAVVAVATAIAWLFFSACGLVINALVKAPSTVRTIGVPVIFALTEIIRISAVYGLSAPENLGGDFGPLFRITAAAMTGVVLFGLMSVVAGDYRSYRQGYTAHAERLRSLTAVLRETESNVELVRTQLAVRIRPLLTENVQDAFALGARGGLTPADIADELFRISDELVRPLSHGLSRDAPAPLPFSLPPRVPRVSLRTFLDNVTAAAPFQPLAVATIVGLLFAPVLVLLPTLGSLLSWVLIVAAVLAIGYVGRRLMGPHLHRWPTAVRIVVITVMFALPGALFMVVAIVPTMASPELIDDVVIYGAVLGALLGWLPAIAEGLQYSRQRFVRELETMDQRIVWFQVRAQAQLWLDQKRLALALHGDVQGTILAAAMQLRNAVVEGPREVRRVIPRVEKTIQRSLQLVHEGPAPRRLGAVVAGINKTWSTLVSLRLEAPREVVAAVEADELCLEITAEIVKELHLNSFKHGRASACVVELAWGEPGTVILTLRNNGRALASREPTQGGLGDNFLSSVTLALATTDEPGGVVVDMVIPVAPRP